MEIPKVKIKGSEIINRWYKVNELTKKLGSSLGEKGYYFRKNGFDIWYDGFNVCDFGCKDINLSFSAFNWTKGHVWTLRPKLEIEGRELYIATQSWMFAEMPNNVIYSEKEYEFEYNYSLAECFEKRIIKPKRFKVTNESNKAVGEWRYFDTFEAADEFAKVLCQQYIDRRHKDYSCRQYYMTSVRNNEQIAKECHELRHYSWYQYELYDHWITIRPCD